MPLALLAYLLTFLAGVVVVATRVRLRRRGGDRRAVSSGLLSLHTVTGLLGLATWILFLISGDWLGEGSRSLLGILGLGFLWITVLAGLLLLLRWKPTRGRHASAPSAESDSGGRWLSLLGHLGMLAGIPVLTYAYLISAV